MRSRDMLVQKQGQETAGSQFGWRTATGEQSRVLPSGKFSSAHTDQPNWTGFSPSQGQAATLQKENMSHPQHSQLTSAAGTVGSNDLPHDQALQNIYNFSPTASYVCATLNRLHGFKTLDVVRKDQTITLRTEKLQLTFCNGLPLGLIPLLGQDLTRESAPGVECRRVLDSLASLLGEREWPISHGVQYDPLPAGNIRWGEKSFIRLELHCDLFLGLFDNTDWS